MVYASRTDGSVIFATGMVPRDEEGRATGPVPQERRVLLAPNERLMDKVKHFRTEIFLGRFVEQNNLRAGRTPKKSKMSTFLGFLPFGERGFLHRRARERAEAHFGEATMRLTSRGTLVVSVDGRVVLRKNGGASFFGFRRKDPTYELSVTDQGIEISRRGVVVWDVKAEDIF
ncbi:unnamed protein product [Ectocarpus fasciculatus]